MAAKPSARNDDIASLRERLRLIEDRLAQLERRAMPGRLQTAARPMHAGPLLSANPETTVATVFVRVAMLSFVLFWR